MRTINAKELPIEELIPIYGLCGALQVKGVKLKPLSVAITDEEIEESCNRGMKGVIDGLWSD